MRGQGKKDSTLTSATLVKKVSAIHNGIRKTKKEINKYEVGIHELKDRIEASTFDLERFTAEKNQLESEIQMIEKDMNRGLYNKQRYLDIIARKQRLLKRYEELNQGKMAKVDPNDVPLIQSEHINAVNNLESIKSFIHKALKHYLY